jgi:glycosyltransferase involved in cell wall biosynthesis
MLKNSCLLTIGIPVYNGERFVRQTLDSLIVALSEIQPSEVEILVSDNASSDQTVAIVHEYKQSGRLSINFFSNELNQGYDRNIDLIAERSQGRYIWFLGCGEIVKPEALKTILPELRKQQFDYVLLNFDFYSEKTGKHDSSKGFPIGVDVFPTSLPELYDICTGIGTAISSNIVLKSAWQKAALVSLKEKGWCHVERINQILTACPQIKTAVLAEACFTLYRELDGWWTTRQFYINFLSYYRIISRLKHALSEKDFRRIDSRLYPMALINAVLVAKKFGISFNKALINLAKNEFGSRASFWLLVVPLFFLPCELCTHRFFEIAGQKGRLLLEKFRAMRKKWL